MPNDRLMTSHLRLASACLNVAQQIQAVSLERHRALLRRAGLEPDAVAQELAAEYEQAFVVATAGLDLDDGVRGAHEAARDWLAEVLDWRSTTRLRLTTAEALTEAPEARSALRAVLRALPSTSRSFTRLLSDLRFATPAARELVPHQPDLSDVADAAQALLVRAEAIDDKRRTSTIARSGSRRDAEAIRLRARLRTVLRQWRIVQRWDPGGLPDLTLWLDDLEPWSDEPKPAKMRRNGTKTDET